VSVPIETLTVLLSTSLDEVTDAVEVMKLEEEKSVTVKVSEIDGEVVGPRLLDDGPTSVVDEGITGSTSVDEEVVSTGIVTVDENPGTEEDEGQTHTIELVDENGEPRLDVDEEIKVSELDDVGNAGVLIMDGETSVEELGKDIIVDS
jgi:hypothetical protein